MQVQLLQAGVLTVNEVRAMRGLGPLGQDGAVQLSGEAAVEQASIFASLVDIKSESKVAFS
jgi:hypothetical protein